MSLPNLAQYGLFLAVVVLLVIPLGGSVLTAVTTSNGATGSTKR